MPVSKHTRAVLLALLVSFLWSTSWVLIKIGLKDIPALTFAGLRYTLAFLVLLPFIGRSLSMNHISVLQLTPGMWGRLVVLGLLFISVTQGAQYLALVYLPAMTNSLLLSFSTVMVALFGIVFLREYPTPLQWAGVGLYLIGVLLYFLPADIPPGQAIGYVIAGICMLANALSSVLGRSVNRLELLPPVVVTVISMGIGGLALLAAGLAFQGLPHLSLFNWMAILWLAVVNSALAFTMWNASLRTLSAMESSIIANTMLFQIAFLAWIFLGERLNYFGIGGMFLAGLGTMLVQFRRRVIKTTPAGGKAQV